MTDHRLTDYVKIFRDEAGEWRWSRHAANHERIAISGEGYLNRHHAQTMAETLNPDITIRSEPNE